MWSVSLEAVLTAHNQLKNIYIRYVVHGFFKFIFRGKPFLKSIKLPMS